MATDRKTILVVDDSSLVRLFYRSILESAGYRVEEALNGLEALEKLLTTQADLLIVDINMPTMDGLTFLTALRQKELPMASIPALITSSEAGEQDFDAARRAGANFYLVKPLEDKVLVEFAAMLSGGSR
jgi:two-component system, chemotaxis family, chemotaxis protein CheY